MAQVDFSNAVIESKSTSAWNKYLGGLNAVNAFVDSGNNIITQNFQNILSYSSNSKKVYLYSGEFTTSGVEFYTQSTSLYRISNISFSTNDTFSFEIEITLSGN